jgi:peptidyl-Lys metalloendopeptidase
LNAHDAEQQPPEILEGYDQEPIANDTELSAHLELPERLQVGEEVNLRFTLTNESDSPLYFLKWYTPLEGIAGEIFKVTRDGLVVPYEGILASRAFPTSDSYVLINPGESVSAVVDLGTSFDFSEVGTYQIGFLSPRISHIARSEKEMAKTDDDLGPVQIPSTPVTLEIGDN